MNFTQFIEVNTPKKREDLPLELGKFPLISFLMFVFIIYIYPWGRKKEEKFFDQSIYLSIYIYITLFLYRNLFGIYYLKWDIKLVLFTAQSNYMKYYSLFWRILLLCQRQKSQVLFFFVLFFFLFFFCFFIFFWFGTGFVLMLLLLLFLSLFIFIVVIISYPLFFPPKTHQNRGWRKNRNSRYYFFI